MFTGIIETLARVEKIERQQSNVHFTFSCSITNELKVDQSLAHNGVCLTVVNITGTYYSVTAIDETIKRTNLGELKAGDVVNIERCMPANGRFDGHIVQGHVDVTATCTNVKDLAGSYEFVFEYPSVNKNITVQKGSIAINGVSLTVVRSEAHLFSVHVIPYTLEHTNFSKIKKGSAVNIEFDIIGKYVAVMMENKIKQ
jgi:riboflavin synthase